MSESENESQGNYYTYSNKGKEYQFNLDDLTTEELKKFEKMTEKQRLRFIANFELQKESTFQDTVSLKPTITEARNEEYNKYALLKQKLDEAEKLGEKLKGYDNYENIELLNSDGNIKDEFNEYFKNINSNDIKNCMSAFDLDNVSVGMLKKYYKKKIEDLHLTGIKTSFLESLKKIYKKFYEIDDEDFTKTKPKVKTTLDRLADFITKLNVKDLTSKKTEQVVQTIYNCLGTITLTSLKNLNITKLKYNTYKEAVDENKWGDVYEMLQKDEYLPKLRAIIDDNLTTIEDLGIDIVRNKTDKKDKNEDTESIDTKGDKKDDTVITTKDDTEGDKTESDESDKTEKTESDETKKNEDETKDTEGDEEDKNAISTPMRYTKKLEEKAKQEREKQEKVKEKEKLDEDFNGFKNLFKVYFKSFVVLKNYYVEHINEEARGARIPKVFNNNTYKRVKQGNNFLYKENDEDNITVKFDDNNIGIAVGDGNKLTIDYNLKDKKYKINSSFYKIKSTFEPNEKNQFDFEFEKAKYDENKIKNAAFKKEEAYYGKGYTPKVKLSFYGKTPECGTYKTTYTSGSLVDKLRNRFLKTVNEDIEGLKETDNEFKDSIKNITDKLNELEMMIKSLKVSTSQTQPVVPKTKPSFLDDITSPVKLKPVKPIAKPEKESTDIEKILSQRRKDIEYSEDSEDSDNDEWGEGYGSKKMKLLDFLKSLE